MNAPSHRTSRTFLRTFALIALLGSVLHGAERAKSAWVSIGPDGKLAYKTTDRGDRIMDFSHAGYMGGGVAIPDVPVKQTVKPDGGEGSDDTPAIQRAIDEVSKLPVDEKGFRGAVLLAPGTFNCSKPLTISVSGVVLRGNGSDKSTINLTGKPHLAIAVRSGDREQRGAGGETSEGVAITDAYVPSGAASLSVKDASGLKVGDTIIIRRPVTDAWVKLMEMHDLTRDGKPQTWMRTGTATTAERNIAAIDGNKITLDVPLSDSFDAHFLNPPGATVIKTQPANRLTQCGVEELRIVSPPQAISHSQDHFSALRLNGQDCWARNLVIDETMNSVGVGGRRITLQNITINRKAKHQGSSRPAEFAPNGSQVLMDRCNVNADNVWFVASGAGVAGPVVVLNCTFTGEGRAESHQRWSTGILYDNVRAADGGIELRNRGSMGSGHGWSMGWGVLWNCVAKHYIVQNPPGTMNWVIGCAGELRQSPRPFGSGPILPGGTIDAHGTPVAPQSLYLTQLRERLGDAALKNVGYDSADIGDAPAKSTDAAAQARPVAASNQPLGPNLALDCPVTTSNFTKVDVAYAGWNALDGDDKTYWKVQPDDVPARLELDTEGAVDINTIDVGEALDQLNRVQAYKLEAMIDSAWKQIAQGTTIGESKIHRIPKTTVWKVRLTIDKAASEGAAIRKVAIHLNPSAS